jgi:hypothetical protein
MHPWARAALCARLRAGGRAGMAMGVRACVPSRCGRRARRCGAECAREAELSDAVLQCGNGNGSFTRSSVSVCERLFLICVLSRVRCIVQLFCLAAISRLFLARPACPSGISAAHPTWTARARCPLSHLRRVLPGTCRTACTPSTTARSRRRSGRSCPRSRCCACAPLPSPLTPSIRAHSVPRVAGRGRR